MPKPLGRHGHRVLNVWWTVPPAAWLSQQSADDVECRRQMSGAGSQQGTLALFHEDSGRPERSRNVTRSGTLNQWSSRSNGVMRSDRFAEKTKRPAAFKTDAAGLAAGRGYQREPSCSSSPC